MGRLVCCHQFLMYDDEWGPEKHFVVWVSEEMVSEVVRGVRRYELSLLKTLWCVSYKLSRHRLR